MRNLFKKSTGIETVAKKTTFDYSKGGVNLSFSLSTIKQKEIFLELLKVAISELEEEL